MKHRSVLLAIAIGCSSSSRDQPTVLENAPSGLPSAAEAAFAKSIALDYRAPADVEPRHALRLAAAEAYLKACKAGDKRSCWRAAVIKPGLKGVKIAHEGLVRAGRNCIAGDMPSCNALVYHRHDLVPLPESYDAPRDTNAARELCKAGLAAGCYAVYNPDLLGEKGDEALVVRGCELGDSMSCAEISYLASNQVATLERMKEYRGREDAAAKVECERGISIGCRHLVYFKDIDEQKAAAILARACRYGSVDDCTGQGIDRATGELAIEVARIACTTLGEACEDLAELVRHDKAAVREALENGCHHRQAHACARLLKAYRDKSLAEPVLGRAASIVKYLCAKDRLDEEVAAVCNGR
jgi:hypothetical protein